MNHVPDRRFEVPYKILMFLSNPTQTKDKYASFRTPSHLPLHTAKSTSLNVVKTYDFNSNAMTKRRITCYERKMKLNNVSLLPNLLNNIVES